MGEPEPHLQTHNVETTWDAVDHNEIGDRRSWLGRIVDEVSQQSPCGFDQRLRLLLPRHIDDLLNSFDELLPVREAVSIASAFHKTDQLISGQHLCREAERTHRIVLAGISVNIAHPLLDDT